MPLPVKRWNTKWEVPCRNITLIVIPKFVAEGEEGEIWVQTDLSASGYWQRPQLSQDTFRNKLEGYDGDWLATGDLGMILGNRFYVTGRIKDVIIINGRNFYPLDLERTLEDRFPAVRPGCNVAFQFDNT